MSRRNMKVARYADDIVEAIKSKRVAGHENNLAI